MTLQDFVDKFNDVEWLAYAIIAGVVLVLAFITSRILRVVIGRFFRSNSEKLNLDPTAFYFTKNAVSFVVYLMALIAIFYAIPELKSIGVALFASAGIFAAIIGFASQAAFSNIVSGVMIVIFKPFRVNDMISVGINTGIVEDITLRHTVIRNFENRRLVIPNSVISGEVILNSDLVDEKVKVHFEMGISYESDHKKAMGIMRELAAAHPASIDNRSADEKARKEPLIPVKIVRFEDSSIVVRAWIWTSNPDKAFMMKCDLNQQIKEAFEANGIEIPYPHRTLIHKTVQDENEG